jgi:PBSX family phage terminase large subunit
MCGKTLSTLKRNVLEPMVKIFGDNSIKLYTSKKEARIFGRKVYLEGAGDIRSENKIRGMTLDGAYCDELSLFGEEFFSMLLSRLSNKGAMLFATTNPDCPAHWLKRKYLDNPKLSLLDLHFSLDDNIFLDCDYIENLKREYTGVFYDRFVKGMWVAAEGRIYPDFEKSKHVIRKNAKLPELALATVGVDFGGNKSASVFTLTGFTKGFSSVYVLEEHYDKENKSAENLIAAFRQKLSFWKQKYPMLRKVYCDSAEQLLVKSFRSGAPPGVEVCNALKKPINTRINMTKRLLGSERLFVSSSCPHLVNAFENALWDSSKSFDLRLDDGTSDIDSLDAFEYSVERFDKELFRF